MTRKGARITVDLGDEDLVKAVKIAAVEQGRTVRDIVVEAFEAGHLLLPIELNAGIKADATGYLAAAGTPAPIAFPSYRVYLYNTCKRTVRVELFAYLTN